MSRLQQLQRFLPVGALGISLVLHLAIFLGISGIILIQAVAPRIIPSGEYSNNSNSSDEPLPPDIDETPDTPNQATTEDAAMEAPQTPTFSIEQISAANASSAPAFTIAPPTSLPLGSTTENPSEGAPPKPSAAASKSASVFRSMSNPFGQVASADDGGLIGYMYDFKQTSDRKPSAIAGDPEAGAKAGPFNAELSKLLELEKSGAAKPKDLEKIKELREKIGKIMAVETGSNRDYHSAVAKFVTGGWPDKPSGDFFRTEKPVALYQLFIPTIRADAAPEAFKAQQYVKPRRWVIVYRGSFTAPETGQFRFVGLCDDLLVVNFKGKNVLDGSLLRLIDNDPELRQPFGKYAANSQLYAGKWMQFEAGQSYPLKVLIGEEPGGVFYAFLMIQKRGEDGPLPVVQFNPTDWPPKFPAAWNLKYEPNINAPYTAKKPFICQ